MTDGSTSAFDPHTVLADATIAVLATLKSNGMPQLSPVTPFYDRAAGIIILGVAHTRAKAANLRRDPRAALQATRADGWAWATAEGTATVSEPATDPHGPEADAIVDLYRRAGRDNTDWDELRALAVSDQLVLVTIEVNKVYGAEVPERLREHGEKFN